MKSTGTCPKCKSKKIGYLENVVNRVDAVHQSHEIKGHAHAPLGVSRTEKKGFLTVIVEGPEGHLEAYFCSKCGFYETYVKDLSTVNFDNLVGFQWVNE